MPQLSDDMYCSQQIIVPPMFPYLLRQYAKAAIRSQPPDLLRWSSAYFRCLSLNLPPPVKPRLEYPIPKDYDGITPGWLRALLYQLQNNSHVDYKLLWDRWMGACQNRTTLLKILCLGGFTDPMAIPFLRFIALCVAFLCENLTQTMILICEVLTEEPEGGSAMITVEIFIDLYTFLAGLDASKFQLFYNRYFTDELLELLEKKKQQEEVEKHRQTVTIGDREMSVSGETVTEEEGGEEGRAKDVISCPDLDEIVAVDSVPSISETEMDGEGAEFKDEEQRKILQEFTQLIDDSAKKLKTDKSEMEEEEDEGTQAEVLALPVVSELSFEEGREEPDIALDKLQDQNAEDGEKITDVEVRKVEDEEKPVEPETPKPEEPKITDADVKTSVMDEEWVEGEEEDEGVASERMQKVADEEEGEETKESVSRTEKIEKYLGELGEAGDEFEGQDQEALVKMIKKEGLAVVKTGEIAGEGAEEVEGLPEEAYIETYISESIAEEAPSHVSSDKFQYEEIEVEPIPGIGPVVPKELVDAVCEYMRKCAKNQHGMVMPRNIRHYACPPLEVLD